MRARRTRSRARVSRAAWQEQLVTVGLMTGALAILAATVVLVSGFARARSLDRAGE